MTRLLTTVRHAHLTDGSLRPRGSTQSYTTLVELHSHMRQLEAVGNLTVVLVLDDRFGGHLSSIIQRGREASGGRLVLVIKSGRLPGLRTIGDLAAASNALGWEQIVFERDAKDAIAGAQSTLRDGERFVVIGPSWHDSAPSSPGPAS